MYYSIIYKETETDSERQRETEREHYKQLKYSG